jgi:GH24 family phage-related lysozyme (muramidase)
LFESGRKNYDRTGCHRDIFTPFGGGGFWSIFEMKKQKQKSRQRRRKLNATQLKRQRNTVLDLTAQGKNRAVVAANLGIGVNNLREEFALELDAGRVQAKAARADEAQDAALTVAEYHVLNNITTSFSSDWYDSELGNLIWEGTDGKGARTVADAFSAWKKSGGKFNVTGLSTRFDKDKAVEFAKIVAEHRKQTEER